MQLVLNRMCLSWALALMAQHQQVDGITEDPVSKGLRKALEGKNEILPGLEEQKKHDQKVMDAISKFRAEVCAKMKEEHGKDFASFDACKEYMEKACHPGRDKQMDGDSKEVTSKEGFCQEYFPVAEKKAEKEVHDEEVAEAAHGPAPGPAPGPSPGPAPRPAPAPAAKAPAAAAPAPAAGAPAPAPMTAPGPGPAPVPAPFTPGISGGKPYGAIADDEKYYFKKGGKDDSRLHMSEKMKLPTQGYWGKLVEHEDMQTSTEDWGHEFGPGANHANIRKICSEHPDNAWCWEQGYHRHHHSSSTTAVANAILLVCSIIAAHVF